MMMSHHTLTVRALLLLPLLVSVTEIAHLKKLKELHSKGLTVLIVVQVASWEDIQILIYNLLDYILSSRIF